VGRVEGNEVSAITLNGAAPMDKRVQDKLINMVRCPCHLNTCGFCALPSGCSLAHEMQMSRRHALLEVVAGQLQLVDLGAVNGSYVNDHRVQQGSKRWGRQACRCHHPGVQRL
jgi:hypothetical protein